MNNNHLLEQKLAGIVSSLDGIPASQLNLPVSQQYAEDYNQARTGVLLANADVALVCPPEVAINPDRGVEATYIEIKGYALQLYNFVHNKIGEENRDRIRASNQASRVIRGR